MRRFPTLSSLLVALTLLAPVGASAQIEVDKPTVPQLEDAAWCKLSQGPGQDILALQLPGGFQDNAALDRVRAEMKLSFEAQTCGGEGFVVLQFGDVEGALLQAPVEELPDLAWDVKSLGLLPGQSVLDLLEEELEDADAQGLDTESSLLEETLEILNGDAVPGLLPPLTTPTGLLNVPACDAIGLQLPELSMEGGKQPPGAPVGATLLFEGEACESLSAAGPKTKGD